MVALPQKSSFYFLYTVYALRYAYLTVLCPPPPPPPPQTKVMTFFSLFFPCQFVPPENEDLFLRCVCVCVGGGGGGGGLGLSAQYVSAPLRKRKAPQCPPTGKILVTPLTTRQMGRTTIPKAFVGPLSCRAAGWLVVELYQFVTLLM